MCLLSFLKINISSSLYLLIKSKPFLIFLFICFSPTISLADNVEEVLVVGQPIDSTGPDFSLTNTLAPSPTSINYGTTMTDEAAEQKAAAEKAARKAACYGEANAAKMQCEDAYQDLNNICQAYIGMLGGYGAGVLIKKMADGAQVLVGRAITISTASGANLAEDIPGCAYLTNRAMDFCADGANKMIKKCSRL